MFECFCWLCTRKQGKDFLILPLFFVDFSSHLMLIIFASGIKG